MSADIVEIIIVIACVVSISLQIADAVWCAYRKTPKSRARWAEHKKWMESIVPDPPNRRAGK